MTAGADSQSSSNMGPMGLGDPNDNRLRKIEKDVLIKNKVRKAAREKCSEEIRQFSECCKGSGIKMPFECKAENEVQISCLRKWFHDEELNELMTQEYLKERSEYRRTGIPVKKYKA